MTSNSKYQRPAIEPLIKGEHWLPVKGHEELYSISSAGRIYSHRGAGRLLHPARGRRIVLAGGRAVSVPDLVLEVHAGQPRPAPGWIAWPKDRIAPQPFAVQNLTWISRAEMMAIFREERAKTAARRHPQPEVLFFNGDSSRPAPPKKPAERCKKPDAQAEVEVYDVELVSSS
jgi:hypothetical protein